MLNKPLNGHLRPWIYLSLASSFSILPAELNPAGLLFVILIVSSPCGRTFALAALLPGTLFPGSSRGCHLLIIQAPRDPPFREAFPDQLGSSSPSPYYLPILFSSKHVVVPGVSISPTCLFWISAHRNVSSLMSGPLTTLFTAESAVPATQKTNKTYLLMDCLGLDNMARTRTVIQCPALLICLPP